MPHTHDAKIGVKRTSTATETNTDIRKLHEMADGPAIGSLSQSPPSSIVTDNSDGLLLLISH